MVVLALIAACVLAFANGANDNAKGVATLIGGRTMAARQALLYAAATTFLGSAAGILLTGGLIARFSGKGLVGADLLGSPAFVACVGIAAAVTVLLATRLALPVSTTHALVGGLTGVALSAGALNVGAVVSAFVVPLVAAPLLALVLAAVVYPLFRWGRTRLGVTRHTCVCIEREFHPVSVSVDGSVILEATGVKLSNKHDTTQCFDRYDGEVAGVDAQRALNGSHIFTAAAISFARGLNDTPKIAALIIAGGALNPGAALVAVGGAMAVGGLIAARRVADTISHRITDMNDGQAFSANLVTAACVIFASRLGAPVSTTHVSCGSLFGIGLTGRGAHAGVIGQVLLAWVTTLPIAGAIGWLAWRLLGA